VAVYVFHSSDHVPKRLRCCWLRREASSVQVGTVGARYSCYGLSVFLETAGDRGSGGVESESVRDAINTCVADFRAGPPHRMNDWVSGLGDIRDKKDHTGTLDSGGGCQQYKRGRYRERGSRSVCSPRKDAELV